MLLKKRLAALILLLSLPLSSCAAPADDAKARHSIEFDALAAAESYRLEHGSYISYYDNPYPTLENSLVSMVPREEYEELIMKYLDMERGAVRSLSRYDEALDAYPIVISGVHDGLAKLPVPEVVEYRENSDGSITLTVDALFVEHATDRAFTHIVTVMPGADGSFKYISNVLLDSSNNILPDYESYFGA